MQIAIVGSRWFGAEVYRNLAAFGRVAAVVAPASEDRLAQAAARDGVRVVALGGRRRVEAADICGPVDLIVAAHAHAFVDTGARGQARLGAIGYHPSLLPLHRGRDSIEQTIRAGDRITGGTIYHLTDDTDAGPIVFADWCFVWPDDDARSLWRRALAPMGIDLINTAVSHAALHGFLPADDQDSRVLAGRLAAA
ncbi:hypothetical protein CH339_13430 [Rhodobium orientis]|uniref:Formyl transferase N-terminal domain-containing protein n=2 Tax=Rhodobium orientis TaxID=34017 RepID=A0A327JMN3_9HYPH|nr:hypothetical protein [Rhodobium orientis]RAI26633.1 hypothetical protein CH339_13430 [Rhodobium orientis]